VHLWTDEAGEGRTPILRPGHFLERRRPAAGPPIAGGNDYIKRVQCYYPLRAGGVE